MASNALAIDAMLPALPAIGEALGVAEDNRRQLVITSYLLGFGLSQLFYGPIADRFGRKPLLIGCMIFYALFGALAGLAGSIDLLLAARFTAGRRGGRHAGAGRRDRPRPLSRLGDGAGDVAGDDHLHDRAGPRARLRPDRARFRSWRHIFIALAVYGLAWRSGAGSGCPRRSPSRTGGRSPPAISAARWRRRSAPAPRSATRSRSTLAFGALFAFIGSIQQIVFDVFGRPELIGLVFACIAGPMAATSYANSRLVMRLGARRLLTPALIAFTSVSLLHLAIVLTWGETLWAFVVLQALTTACFGLVGANSGRWRWSRSAISPAPPRRCRA